MACVSDELGLLCLGTTESKALRCLPLTYHVWVTSSSGLIIVEAQQLSACFQKLWLTRGLFGSLSIAICVTQQLAFNWYPAKVHKPVCGLEGALHLEML